MADIRPRKPVYLGVKLTTDDAWALKRAAKRHGSVSEFVRLAIRKALAEQSAGATQ